MHDITKWETKPELPEFLLNYCKRNHCVVKNIGNTNGHWLLYTGFRPVFFSNSCSLRALWMATITYHKWWRNNYDEMCKTIIHCSGVMRVSGAQGKSVSTEPLNLQKILTSKKWLSLMFLLWWPLNLQQKAPVRNKRSSLIYFTTRNPILAPLPHLGPRGRLPPSAPSLRHWCTAADN